MEISTFKVEISSFKLEISTFKVEISSFKVEISTLTWGTNFRIELRITSSFKVEFQSRDLEFQSRDLEFQSRDLEYKDYYGMALIEQCTAGGRRSPAVACWASDDWVVSKNPLGGKFRH